MHPNVVNVYDVGEDQGANYMVMELVEGITLKQYIQKRDDFPQRGNQHYNSDGKWNSGGA